MSVDIDHCDVNAYLGVLADFLMALHEPVIPARLLPTAPIEKTKLEVRVYAGIRVGVGVRESACARVYVHVRVFACCASFSHPAYCSHVVDPHRLVVCCIAHVELVQGPAGGVGRGQP